MWRVYWCSDPCLRGCIIRPLLEAAGTRVLIPASSLNPETLRLPARGSRFQHEAVYKILSPKGACFPDNMPEGAWSGTGDVDILAVSDKTAIVFEVKSRIVPRIIRRAGLRAARLALQYHLDEPLRALGAWQELNKTRSRTIENLLDSPSSIAELARAVIAVYAGLVKAAKNLVIKRIVAGTIVPFYATPLAQEIVDQVSRVAAWTTKCTGIKTTPLVLAVYPDKLGIPGKARLECIGGECNTLKLYADYKLRIPEGVHECQKCPYYPLCQGLWTRT